ncbi:MAG: tRNA lysidine(34) synthetase TilS [candidate division KSB1 bacterium]|nr:tRNA lysidine(34) synthetase TilS [candidate division KSB1 bacterium]
MGSKDLLERLTERFEAFVDRHGLIEEGQRLGAAVSGGLDSMLLLLLLERIREKRRLELFVLHFNHCLRGEESDGDEAFVCEYCKSRGIPFSSEAADVTAFAASNKLSLETAARELRYRFFEAAAQSLALGAVATAHTADDQAETVLDHLLRGCGIKGLSGIPVKRGLYIRPLLFAERRELAEAAEAIGLVFREDSSNRNPAFRRNRIRLVLLPLLKEQFNPRVVAALNRLAESASELDGVQETAAEEMLHRCLIESREDKIVLDNQLFLAYLNSLQRLILQQALRILRDDPRRLSFAVWENLSRFLRSGRFGKSFRLGRDIEISLEGERLTISRLKAVPEPLAFDKLKGAIPLWDDLIMEITPAEKPLIFAHPATVAYLDADALRPPFQIRPFQAGDRFRPLNGVGRKKVSDLMNEAHVPRHERKRLPILLDQEGIVWVCGLRLDDRVKITETTRNCLKLTLLHDRKINL